MYSPAEIAKRYDKAGAELFTGNSLLIIPVLNKDAAVNTASAKVALSFSDAFLRGILCNILVCIAVWISFSAEDAAGKIIGLYLPIVLFVISGYEHCVANMYFIPAGILASQEYSIVTDGLTWKGFLVNNLLPVTLGNIVGGACIVGMGYFFVYLHTDEKKSECVNADEESLKEKAAL